MTSFSCFAFLRLCGSLKVESSTRFSALRQNECDFRLLMFKTLCRPK
ncbi:MAG TPA: hypothetical protein VM821_07075 [Abditibacteriaceae bacterium]|nr:hypothetical protein [Abditibacteriaceae bacterium]